MRKLIVLFALLVSVRFLTSRSVEAQAGSASTLPPSICYQVLHTSCVISAGVTTYALSGDGLWISLNGGAWAQVQTGPVVAGVVSWNGQTGVVTYNAPVTSVNGKTGNVTLSLQ